MSVGDSFYEGQSAIQIIGAVLEHVPVLRHRRLGDPLPPLGCANRRVVILARNRALDVLARLDSEGAIIVAATDRGDPSDGPAVWFVHQQVALDGSPMWLPSVVPEWSRLPQLTWQERLSWCSEIHTLYREVRDGDGRWSRASMPSLVLRSQRH
jgi:hypothetical protein